MHGQTTQVQSPHDSSLRCSQVGQDLIRDGCLSSTYKLLNIACGLTLIVEGFIDIIL